MKNKRLLSLLLCICLAVSCLAGITVSASADDTITYTVKKGDYLYQVCKRNGLDYYTCKNAIMILNGWSTETQCNRIVPGQVIYLPASNDIAKTVKASATTTTSSTETVTINGKSYSTTTTTTSNVATKNGDTVAYYLVPYTVKSGDYLAKICSDLNTSYTAYKNIINSVNGITGTRIYAGKTLYIPVATPPAGSSCFAVIAHRVDAGETMTSICNGLGGQPASSVITQGVNYGININYIAAGQVVYVPVAATSPVPTPTPTPVSKGYDINLIYDSTGGIPTAKVDSNANATKADAGKSVFIMANAKSGFGIEKITVTRKDNNADVVVKDNTFVMPPCSVDVNVIYSKAWKITKDNTNNGSFSVVLLNEKVEYARYNDSLVVDCIPDTGYAVKAVKVNGSSISQQKDGSYSFQMPNKNTTVSVEFEKAEPLSIATVSTNGTVTYKVNGTNATKAAKNAKVEMNIAPKTDYIVQSVVVKDSENKSVAVSKVKDNEYSFAMPDKAVTVTVNYQYVKTYALTAAQKDGGVIGLYVNNGSTYVTASKVLKDTKVYIIPAVDSSKVLNGATAKYANNNSSTPVEKKTGDDYYSFVMPANDVTVTPIWGANQNIYQIVKTGTSNGSYTVKAETVKGSWSEVSTGIKDGEIRIFTNADKGYKVDKVTVKIDGTTWPCTFDATNNCYSFTNGSTSKAEIAVTFIKDEATIYKISGKGRLLVEDASKQISGSYIEPTVNVKVDGYITDNTGVGSIIVADFAVPNGYTVDNAYIVDGSTWTKLTANNGVYSYKILSTNGTNLVLCVDFKATQKYTVSYSADSAVDSYNYVLQAGNDAPVAGKSITAYAGQTITIKESSGTIVGIPSAFTGSGSAKTQITVSGTAVPFTFTMPAANVATEVKLTL